MKAVGKHLFLEACSIILEMRKVIYSNATMKGQPSIISANCQIKYSDKFIGNSYSRSDNRSRCRQQLLTCLGR